jgi:ferredoxin
LYLKKQPKPGLAVSSPFMAEHDANLYMGCQVCIDRCQMEAFAVADCRAVLNRDRCIGCGLCVSTCPSGALRLVRKSPELQPCVPKNQRDAYILRAQARAAVRMGMDDKLIQTH